MVLPASVQWKIDRAQKHVADLMAWIAEFGRRQPYDIVPDHNADSTEHYLHLRMREPFPGYAWGCILGDAVQSLRSALDHLIYAIAVREEGADPPSDAKRLMFPILDPPRPLALNRIDSLSKEVRAQVQREQPDPSRLDDSVLWRLDQLNLADKHRVIAVTLVHGESGRFLIFPKSPAVGVPRWNMRPLDGKAPLFTITFDRPVPEVEMGSMGTGLVCIERITPDGKPDPTHPWVVGDLLADLNGGVRTVIDRVWAAVPP